MATEDTGSSHLVGNYELTSMKPKSISASASAGQHKGKTAVSAAPYKQRGARRLAVDDQGELTYKSTPSSTLMASLQLGLQHSIGSIEPRPRRDILMTDFEVVETVEFPAEGSAMTPAHRHSDFTLKTYSPEAFRFFREAFGILAEDYLIALCDRPLRELSNPGASGSLFYLSADDNFIMKTVQKKEAKFLQKLLPGYYLNLTQNKRTLLPKFFGLYRYKCGSVNIRIVVMNNLLPSTLTYNEKYDLKGSTYKRKASSRELAKNSPTFKDVDFKEKHEEGISLSPEKYDILMKSVARDCKVLESFGIMDYSLLLGVHNLDQAMRERLEAASSPTEQLESGGGGGGRGNDAEGAARHPAPVPSRIDLSKNFSIISVEDIPLAIQNEELATAQASNYPTGYIQGRIRGDCVLLYLGVIDILQSYRFKKKLEHTFKGFITDRNTVSVHNPSYYSRRFQDFFGNQVFRREKVKFRTRKNSAAVQFHGRKQGAQQMHPIGAHGHFRRQASKDRDTREPIHASPTHLAGPTQLDGEGFRRRALSESLATRREPQLPEIPPLDRYRLKTSEQAVRSSTEDHGRVQAEGRRQEKRVMINIAEGPESEFASNVKGTSTPINDDSPNLESSHGNVPGEHSRTFDPSASVAETNGSTVVERGETTLGGKGEVAHTSDGRGEGEKAHVSDDGGVAEREATHMLDGRGEGEKAHISDDGGVAEREATHMLDGRGEGEKAHVSDDGGVAEREATHMLDGRGEGEKAHISDDGEGEREGIVAGKQEVTSDGGGVAVTSEAEMVHENSQSRVGMDTEHVH